MLQQEKAQGDHGQSCPQGLGTVPSSGWCCPTPPSPQQRHADVQAGGAPGAQQDSALGIWEESWRNEPELRSTQCLHAADPPCGAGTQSSPAVSLTSCQKRFKMLEFSLEFWSWDLKILQTLGLIGLHISVFPVSHSSLVTRDLLSSTYEIKWNKNHIKNYYHLTAISLHIAVTSWWISHLVQWMF